MKTITNQEARKGKETIYRQILAACLQTIRDIGPVPEGKARYYCAMYRTFKDYVVGTLTYDRQLGKWTHAECRFWTGNGDETETRMIMFA